MSTRVQRSRYEQLELETLLLSRYLIPMRHPADLRTLERSWYLLLSRIEAQGPMSISELSSVLMLDVSTLNRQTAALTKAGHVERVPDPDGGLARKFKMTESGLAALHADRARNVEGITSVLEDWQDDEVDDLIRLLRKFTGSIENRPTGHVWPRD